MHRNRLFYFNEFTFSVSHLTLTTRFEVGKERATYYAKAATDQSINNSLQAADQTTDGAGIQVGSLLF